MELKLETKARTKFVYPRSNRTFMELKQGEEETLYS